MPSTSARAWLARPPPYPPGIGLSRHRRPVGSLRTRLPPRREGASRRL